jgi:serralysin
MRFPGFKRGFSGKLGRGILGLAAATLCIPSAQAAFHLWTIREIYTDTSGSLQFLELFDFNSGENFVNGMQINVANVGNTVTHTFTIPGSSLSGDTANHALLFGTSGLAAHGGPTPDYIIPNGFLFSAGGSISFFGANSGSYTAMPTDGVNSRTWGDGNAANSPRNYGGQTGFVVAPEPSALALLGIGCLAALARRRNASL